MTDRSPGAGGGELPGAGGGEARAAVDGRRLWSGGAVTALVVALVVLLGVVACRAGGVPGLAGDPVGTLAAASVAGYALMWAATVVLLTGGLHLLLVLWPRPLRLFVRAAAVLVLTTVVAPLTAGGPLQVKLASALVNLAAGGAAVALLRGVGRAAVRSGLRRPYIGAG